MTPKQRRFAEEYILDNNAAAAAIRAGFSERTAKNQGYKCLQRKDVQALIAELRADQSERTQITADRVLEELARVGFANMLDYMRVGADGDPVLDFSGLTREQAAALAEVTVEDFKDGRGDEARDVRRVRFKLADKLGALAKIGQHLGMFKDKVELTGKDGGPVQIEGSGISSLLARVKAASDEGGGNP